MLVQGYKGEEITILTLYKEQLRVINKEFRQVPASTLARSQLMLQEFGDPPKMPRDQDGNPIINRRTNGPHVSFPILDRLRSRNSHVAGCDSSRG